MAMRRVRGAAAPIALKLLAAVALAVTATAAPCLVLCRAPGGHIAAESLFATCAATERACAPCPAEAPDGHAGAAPSLPSPPSCDVSACACGPAAGCDDLLLWHATILPDTRGAPAASVTPVAFAMPASAAPPAPAVEALPCCPRPSLRALRTTVLLI